MSEGGGGGVCADVDVHARMEESIYIYICERDIEIQRDTESGIKRDGGVRLCQTHLQKTMGPSRYVT